ncbi:MAG: 4Fe-4S dicluster domain-containing protein [Bacteroidales bacterium]
MEPTVLKKETTKYGNTSLCYQCAKCSAGCPIGGELDIFPHQVIHLASLGLEERVLHSETIWICASCYACAVKCPNDIDITGVMNDLKNMAIEKGIESKRPEVYKFHKTFAEDVLRRGKAHELRIMGEYNLRLRKPFKNVLLAPQMLLKKKLKFLPPKSVRGFKNWIRKILSKTK